MNRIHANSLEPPQEQLGILLKYYQTGRYADAEKLSLSITKEFPKHQFAWKVLGAVLTQMGKINESLVATQKSVELDPQDAKAHYNLGVILRKLGKLEEAEAIYRKAIKLKPDFVGIHYNFGNTLKDLGKLDEAETSYRKAIKLKPDYAEAHNNLGNTLKELGRLEDAETSYKKAIELKPDYLDACYNLGVILYELGRLDEAEESYRKVIQLKSDHADVHVNLNLIKTEREILFKVLQVKKYKKTIRLSNLNSSIKLTPIPFFSNRDVEDELINYLYESKSKNLSQTRDVFFGNGSHSINFQFLDNNIPIIKKIKVDLVRIMKQAVKSDIFIGASFFINLNNGAGSNPHTHIREFDKINKLVNQKYSLQYYLSIGDQNCTEPGIFKMNDPDEEFLPTKGMITIIPASRKHSAIYNGKKDRIMIGVNFYSLI
jgi:tetratricopeptide (TPR) repeat protein